MYSTLFRVVLARLDPEKAHHLAFAVIQRLPWLGFGRLVARFTRPRTDLSVETLGTRFPTPFGLAAGFDKDARAVIGLGQLGFGHVEVGTLTARAQPGNPTPRLFRLVDDEALINRMGFNNGGSAAARPRIRAIMSKSRRPIVGINIGKSKVTEMDAAIGDYLVSTSLLAPLADYLVVNVSSPNTPGLRGLQEIEMLSPLLEAVKREAGSTPLLVKIAPDLLDDQVVEIARLAVRLGLDGIIATKTSPSGSAPGQPLCKAILRSSTAARCGRGKLTVGWSGCGLPALSRHLVLGSVGCLVAFQYTK